MPNRSDGLRLFRCKKCNYYNKYGRSSCSYCFVPTTVLNRFWLPPLVVLVGVGAAAMSGLVDLGSLWPGVAMASHGEPAAL